MSVSIKALKKEAKLEKIRLQKLGSDNISYGNCLHAAAKKYGYKDYKHLIAEYSKIRDLIELTIRKISLNHGLMKISNQLYTNLYKMNVQGDLHMPASKILSIMSESKSFVFTKNELELAYAEHVRVLEKYASASIIDYSGYFEKTFQLLVDCEYIYNQATYDDRTVDKYILNPTLFWYEREYISPDYIEDFIKNYKFYDNYLELNFGIYDGYLCAHGDFDITDPCFKDNVQNNNMLEGKEFDAKFPKAREILEEEADEIGYQIFGDTDFQSNNQWVNDNIYSIIYEIKLDAPWLKENIEYLKNKLS